MNKSKAWLLLALVGLCLAAAGLFSSEPSSTTSTLQPELGLEDTSATAHHSPQGNGLFDEPEAKPTDLALEENQLETELEVERRAISNPGSIFVRSRNGEGIDAKMIIIHDQEALQLEIQRATLVGDSLWENIIDIEGDCIEGEFTLDRSELTLGAENLLMVFARGHEPYIQSLGTNPSFPVNIELSPVEPIHVLVQDPSGNPIAGAVVAVRPAVLPSANEENSLVEKMRWLYFQDAVYADEHGKAAFTTVQAEGNNIIVQPKNGFASASADMVLAGSDIVVSCDVAFQVHGKILDSDRMPLVGARAKAYIDTDDGFVFVNAGHADEDGNFTIDRLPASEPSVQIFASMEGYETASKTVSLPKRNGDYPLDFELYPAVGGSVQLVTSTGAPIQAAYLSFYRSNADYVPGYYLTDQEGKAELRAGFRKGYPYLIKVQLGGLMFQLTEAFYAGSHSTLVVPNLSRFSSWEIPADLLQKQKLQYCIWTPDESSVPGYSWWNPEDPCPWLPSGRGVFAAHFEDGSCLEKKVILEDGVETAVSLTAPGSHIEFQIPNDTTASVYLFSAGRNNLFQAHDVSGLIRIPCEPGLYDLHLTFPNQPVQKRAGVRVPQGGLNLGELGIIPTASLDVAVVDADGRPLPGCFVSLAPPGGFVAVESWTEEDGIAKFEGLTAGPYFLYCSSEETYHLQGREALTSIQILPGEQQELRFSMGGASGEVQVHLDRQGLPLPQGFFINSLHRINYHLPSNGTGSFPASAKGGYIGVSANKTGYAFVAAKEIPAGPGVYELERTSLRKIRLRFQNEFAQPQAGLLIGLYLAGQHLPYRPVTDSAGELLLEIQPGIPLELEVWIPTGELLRFPVSDLSSGQEILIPENIARKRIQFHDNNGTSIPGLLVTGDGFPETIFPRHDGSAEVPLFPDRSYLAMASGFFPITFDPNQVSEVTLRNSVGPLVFTLDSPETKHLYVRSRSLSNSPRALEGWAHQSLLGTWSFPTLPEGDAVVTAYSENDDVLGEYVISLKGDTHHYPLK